MIFELDTIRSTPRDHIEGAPKAQPTAPHRKVVREITDAMINDALMVNSLPVLASTLSALMLAVAETVDRFEIEPGVQDFMEAARLLIDASRTVFDRGLLMTHWVQAREGAVMLELTVRGICAALSVPYEEVLREVHRASVAGEPANVQAILVAAGLIQEAPADDMDYSSAGSEQGCDG